jgi:hypothetical protein
MGKWFQSFSREMQSLILTFPCLLGIAGLILLLVYQTNIFMWLIAIVIGGIFILAIFGAIFFNIHETLEKNRVPSTEKENEDGT